MAFTLKRVGARGLLAAWGVYWAALLLVGGRAVLRMVTFAASAPTGHTSLTASMDGGRLHMEALLDGHVVDGASTSMLALALWVAGPPLLLWLLWLAQRPRRALAASSERQALRPADRWTPTSYHEALRRETMREQDEP